MDLEENQAFWRDSHNPLSYLNAPRERTDFLVEVVAGLLLDSPAILEIGCNSGRNLFGLWDAGYRDLTGIEINLSAIRLMREARPDCTIAAIPHAVEDIIQQLPSRHFDVIYTMAVLLHLHQKSEWVFAEMVRICAHYLITIEREDSNAKNPQGIQRHWRRNYRTVFEALGMRQLDVQNGPGDLSKYVLRVFERK
jgi:SAM-dependent methyltransferase